MFTDLRKTQRAYQALTFALVHLRKQQPEHASIEKAIARGYFLPEEDDHLWSLISRYLTIRGGFWEIIEDMSSHFSDNIENVTTLDDWRHFLLGYAASCQAVRMARILIDDLAKHRLVQRKINEGSPQNRIPRKVFTSIYRSLSDTDNAIKIQYMMNLVEANREFINTLSDDKYVSEIVKNLEQLESTLNPSQLSFLKLRMRYLWHALTRRFAVTKQITSFFILENAGRVIADIGIAESSRITAEIQAELEKILQPGDVMITRHDFVASNLFLPGYWPHAALYIGSEDERKALDIDIDKEIAERWSGEVKTLEAQKDGVLFRSLNETLEVDEVIILRPDLSREELAKALSRICVHEGKGYNFDFDFFRSDQLVCTEVIYRAYDGLGDIKFNLVERVGRLSLSAEDILDMAVQKRGFNVVAAVGFEGCRTQVITGKEVSAIVSRSY